MLVSPPERLVLMGKLCLILGGSIFFSRAPAWDEINPLTTFAGALQNCSQMSPPPSLPPSRFVEGGNGGRNERRAQTEIASDAHVHKPGTLCKNVFTRQHSLKTRGGGLQLMNRDPPVDHVLTDLSLDKKTKQKRKPVPWNCLRSHTGAAEEKFFLLFRKCWVVWIHRDLTQFNYNHHH